MRFNTLFNCCSHRETDAVHPANTVRPPAESAPPAGPPPTVPGESTSTPRASNSSGGNPQRLALYAAQARPKPPSKETYFAHLDAWAQEGGDNENRTVAVGKIKQWWDNKQPEAKLYLGELGLTSLPDLPASLQKLEVPFNRLTSLPENLPASLEKLDVRENRLTSLPENLPASLEDLELQGNRLTSLPENLPASLQLLEVGHNQLTSLPENLPASLECLVVNHNQLTSLPENIIRLSQDCEVDLDNNPFPDGVLNRLREVVNAEGYNGPRIIFAMATASDAAPNRPLPVAVADWYEEGDSEAVKNKWKGFANEENAELFSTFLDRLHNTVNSGNPQFKPSVAEWLSHLAANPALREQSFLISSEASTSCEDRVSLFFNSMKKARIAADVESGIYDNELGKLLSLARGMFRLDALENIAREKEKSLRFVDPIEVYLAYQVKLREPLHLPLDTPDMRFFGVSYVTEDDLANAEKSVKASEQQEFVHYLSTDWQPWQSVLKRLDGTAYEAAQNALVEATGEEFSTRLSARLKEMGLENDDDAARAIGPQVMAEITREINAELTRKFLATQGLSALLSEP